MFEKKSTNGDPITEIKMNTMRKSPQRFTSNVNK